MADTNTPNTSDRSSSMQREQGSNQQPNQTMQHEQAKASVSGGSQNSSGRNSDQFGSQDGMGEQSAIGGGENRSQTGEAGRARSELDQKQKQSEQTSR